MVLQLPWLLPHQMNNEYKKFVSFDIFVNKIGLDKFTKDILLYLWIGTIYL